MHPTEVSQLLRWYNENQRQFKKISKRRAANKVARIARRVEHKKGWK